MVKRRLELLGHPDSDQINLFNEDHYRKLVVYLEDRHIRKYSIEERQALRAITNNNWLEVYEKYLIDLNCPIQNSKLGQIEWLLGLAITLEHAGEISKGVSLSSDKLKQKKLEKKPVIKSENPLDSLDFESDAFKAGVNDLAALLRIPRHSNHLITLEGLCKLIKNRLNEENLKKPQIHKGKAFPLEADIGFGLNNKKLERIAKILVLLHIQELRELQTRINETIVAVQSVTANPKTDTRLGKVGK